MRKFWAVIYELYIHISVLLEKISKTSKYNLGFFRLHCIQISFKNNIVFFSVSKGWKEMLLTACSLKSNLNVEGQVIGHKNHLQPLKMITDRISIFYGSTKLFFGCITKINVWIFLIIKIILIDKVFARICKYILHKKAPCMFCVSYFMKRFF